MSLYKIYSILTDWTSSVGKIDLQVEATFSQSWQENVTFSPHLERPSDEQVFITNKQLTNKESVKKPMGTKSFVQIEINAVFTSTSGKMQFRSGVFDHFNHKVYVY
jgi:hypothetical protein